jgi:hypothetical protein
LATGDIYNEGLRAFEIHLDAADDFVFDKELDRDIRDAREAVEEARTSSILADGLLAQAHQMDEVNLAANGGNDQALAIVTNRLAEQ